MADNFDRTTKKSTPTFFMYPNTSIMPNENFFELLMIHGYEVYNLPEERIRSPEEQVDALANIFDEFILFINISHVSRGPKSIDWMSSIRNISEKYVQRIRIGVVHQEKSDEIKIALQEYYLMTLKIQGGCIALSDKIKENIFIIGMILSAAEARGGEKRRAKREGVTGRLNFYVDEKRFTGAVINISIKGMLIFMDDESVSLKQWELIKDIQIMLPGGSCRVNAVVAIKRLDEQFQKEVYVLLFRRKEGRIASEDVISELEGVLDKEEQTVINHCIYDFSKKKIMHRVSDEIRKTKKD